MVFAGSKLTASRYTTFLDEFFHYMLDLRIPVVQRFPQWQRTGSGIFHALSAKPNIWSLRSVKEIGPSFIDTFKPVSNGESV